MGASMGERDDRRHEREMQTMPRGENVRMKAKPRFKLGSHRPESGPQRRARLRDLARRVRS